ncbi:hypothetical protein [Luteimicrobium sp. DT211]|uniref:hypothetical protein n=1 Tax=Luteimicrobium sp. DT211 TaxID=3393412 RepID=UPI003CEF0D25
MPCSSCSGVPRVCLGGPKVPERPGDDWRRSTRVEVYLTDDGRALAERGAAQVRAALEPSTATLTGAERRRLQALLEKLVDAGLR